MLGVMFGIVSMITLLSIGEGAKQKILAQLEQLGVDNIIVKSLELTKAQKANSREHLSSGLSPLDLLTLKSLSPYVKYAIPLIKVSATMMSVREEFYPEILATSAEFGLLHNRFLEEGRFLCDLDSERRNFVCVLGHDIARQLGLQGHLGGTIRLQNEIFKIVGILRARRIDSFAKAPVAVRDLNRVILIPLGTQTYIASEATSPGYSEIIVKISQKNMVPAGIVLIKSILRYNHKNAEDFQMIVPQELIQQQKRTQMNLNILLMVIALISLLVGGIGIMNIMLATISERTKEIGIRRALGASQDHIKWQFLAESLFISACGGIIGLALGLGFILLASALGDWTPVIRIWFLLLSLGMALAIGLCSGLYPALKASRMNPLDALRHE
jgi:putative ABC transport system permease protein